MPFTLSHTAAALPFLERSKAIGWRTALVVGTMAPDLLFPIPYFGERHRTHSLLGLFTLDIPFAFLVSAIWIFVFAKRMSRLPGIEALGARDRGGFSVSMTLLGAFVGSATHLVWDMFTHQGSPLLDHGFVYHQFYLGETPIFNLQGLLWYSNSIFGLVVAAWWAREKFHSHGHGVRRALFSRPWLRIYGAFLLPYVLIAMKILHGSLDDWTDSITDLGRIAGTVRVGLLASILLALSVALWETRARKNAST